MCREQIAVTIFLKRKTAKENLWLLRFNVAVLSVLLFFICLNKVLILLSTTSFYLTRIRFAISFEILISMQGLHYLFYTILSPYFQTLYLNGKIAS